MLPLAVVRATAAGPAPPKIAIVTSREIKPYEQAAEAFRRQVLAEIPRAEIAVYYLNGDSAKGEALVSALAANHCGLIHVVGTEAYKSVAPRIADTSIPLVISMVYDPEGEFHLGTAAESRTYGAPLRVPMPSQLEVVKSFCPGIRRVSYIYTKDSTIPPDELAAAAASNIELVGIPIGDLGQLGPALETARTRSDAFLMILDPAVYTKATTQNVLLYFMRARMPVLSFAPNYAKAGALLSISTRYEDNGAAAGRLAAEILAGTPVRNRFVPTPQLRLDWNSRAGEVLGIPLTPANRARCTDIYGS
jgi:ABC-type uncharacterized transport system substrate-binding protein